MTPGSIDISAELSVGTDGKVRIERTVPISEIYGPVVQGEGDVIGTPTIFVRVGGCDYRCSWCDSLHAVLPAYKSTWTKMGATAIVRRIRELTDNTPCLVTLSGGNPALYDMTEVVTALQTDGYRVAIETQGSKAPAWLSLLDVLTISPKPPSSGMETDYEALARTVQRGALGGVQTSLKVVIFDEHDYAYAQDIGRRFPGLPLFLQVGNPDSDAEDNPSAEDLLNRLQWLWTRVIADRWYDVRVLPQLHTLLFGNARGT